MLSINMSDVMNVINSIRTYLIAIGAIIITAILIQLLVSRMKKPGRRLIRGPLLSRRSQVSASA